MKKNQSSLIFALALAGCASPATKPTPVPPLPSTAGPVIAPKTTLKRTSSAMASSQATPQVQLSVSRKVSPPPTVTLGWTASVSPTVTNYNFYTGLSTGNYFSVTNVGNVTQTTISNLSFSTTYYFAVTATDSSGHESSYSNEVPYTSPTLPLPPGNLIIQSSFAMDTKGPWLTDTNWPAIVIANPLGNQLWKLDISRAP